LGRADRIDRRLRKSALLKRFAACANCGDGDQTDCMQATEKTACKEASDALKTSCGGASKFSGYSKACSKAGESSLAGPIRKLCE
jgi:hypothetical protein